MPKRALPRVLEMPKVVPAKLGAMSMKEEKNPGERAPLKKKPMQIWEEVLDENSVRPKTGLHMPYYEKADDVLDKQMPERQRLWRSGQLHMMFSVPAVWSTLTAPR